MSSNILFVLSLTLGNGTGNLSVNITSANWPTPFSDVCQFPFLALAKSSAVLRTSQNLIPPTADVCHPIRALLGLVMCVLG